MKLNYNVTTEELRPHNNSGIRKETSNLIREFLSTGLPAAKVESETPVNTLYGRFSGTIRKDHIGGVKVVRRGAALYLVRG